MSKEIIIEIKNLSKSFMIYHEKKNTFFEFISSFFQRGKSKERLQVLKNISFNVKKGEMIGIIGSNGSGKTTLLKLITKILVPDSGTIYTNGSIIPLLGLGTGFNEELTAKENVLFYGLLLGFTKKEITKKLDKIIKFAELEKFVDTKLKNFSTGMYARLAFSTAIEVNPDILIVDEVLSVGDASFQEKSFAVFNEFKKKDKTILFVSHNLEEIRKLCDRALWINQGEIQLIGDPVSVINEYEKFSQTKKI